MTDRQGLIAFHYPAPLAEVLGAGSQLRPVRMLEAFESLGYEVFAITGRAGERRARMRQLRGRIAGGDRVDLCYGESTTMPTPLTEPHHVPTHPFLDARFVSQLHRSGVPTGIFYRDIQWRFPQYRDVPLAKRAPALVAYRTDLWWYRRALDVLFLPSLEMRAAIPGSWPLDHAGALPPGGDLVDGPRRPPSPGVLRLFYVGAVTPPRYDIRPLLEACRAVPGVELTLCCPARERPMLQRLGALVDGVHVVHAAGATLRQHYLDADVASIVYAPDEYRDFAMPVKLFEAIGSGVPLLASGPSSAADFVAEHDVGWTADDTEAAIAVLRRLVSDPDEVRHARARVLAVRHDHTWQARARQAVDRLLAR